MKKITLMDDGMLLDFAKLLFPTALGAWIIGISLVHYMIFVLSVSNILLMVLFDKNKKRIDTNSNILSDGQVARLYNSNGNVVGTRYTEQIENGYWVSVLTDDEWNLRAEHIRTFANIEKNKSDRDSSEHKYNKEVVWGEKYYKKGNALRFAEKMRKRKAMRI